MPKKIIQLNEGAIKEELRKLVRGSVEEALIEMYLAGVSVRSVEDITEALWERYRHLQSASLTRKRMSTLRNGETDRSKAANTHTSMWMASISKATGAANMRTSACLRRWASMKMVTVRLLAFKRA